MNLFTEFQRATDEYAGKPAIRTKDGALSYAEVSAAAVQGARCLRARGLRPGDVAALLAPNSPEFAEVFFGIQAIGAVALPLNCLLRAEDLVFQLRHSGARILVASPLFSEALGALRGTLPELTILTTDEVLAAGSGEAVLISDPEADQPAVLMYTSGTTADPKGVLLSHRNLISNYRAFQDRFEFTAEDHFIAALPFFHSFGLTAVLLATQLTGASMEPMAGFHPQECIQVLDRAVNDEGMRTVFLGVPPMFNLMARVPGEWRMDRLYVAISGGAALPQPTFDRFRDRFECEILQGYGLTEAAPVVACNTHGNHRPGTIGQPFSGIEVEVWDANGYRLGSGEQGELTVRGPNVMIGYLNNPEATRGALTTDGWLHTGDLARIDSDRFITISGRMKDLIISAGENIHPQEIEAVLAEHPKIAEVAVTGTEDALKGEVPVAFVVTVPGETLEKKELRGFCLERLPEIRVPRHFVFLESLPKTATGKVAKRRLPGLGE
jgi:long-chain acyl-CoA synthetase